MKNSPSTLEKLRTSEIRYRRLFEAAQDGILILNAVTLKITDVNPFMTELLCYPRAAFLGKELWEIGLFDDKEASQAAFKELQVTGYLRYEDLPLETKHGESRDVEFISNVYEEDGHPVIQCNIRDITERKHAENEIRMLHEELEQRVANRTAQLEAVNKELEAFSYSVSHDLRAPLRHINGFSQALLEDYADVLDDIGKGHLQEVRNASQKMAQLIDEVLQLARMSRSEIRREQIDLSELAADILTELQKGEPERRVKVTIEKGLVAFGDKRLLRTVLTNLLGNAWKFTSKKKAAEIAFGWEEADGRAAGFFVRDNGAGFDMAYADKLYGTFQRLHGANEFEGTGIGLATVQRILHRHGGSVWAEGIMNEGATFYFTLPEFKELGNGQ